MHTVQQILLYGMQKIRSKAKFTMLIWALNLPNNRQLITPINLVKPNSIRKDKKM
jgi:hypothetical protein